MLNQLKTKIEEIDKNHYTESETDYFQVNDRLAIERKAILNSYKDIAEEELEFLEKLQPFARFGNGTGFDSFLGRIRELKQVIEYCKEELKC